MHLCIMFFVVGTSLECFMQELKEKEMVQLHFYCNVSFKQHLKVELCTFIKMLQY